MPTLASMYSQVNLKSYYSRDTTELYDALSAAGFRVYAAVLKEFKGTFLQINETALSITPNVNTLTMPSDFTQLVHLAERVTGADNWHPIEPTDISNALCNVQMNLGWFDYGVDYGAQSQFQFYGPYLDSTDALSPAATQLHKIRLTPMPSDNRYVQLAYTAKWTPITSAASSVMLPDEGTYAMQNYAISSVLQANDDSLSERYEMKADKDLGFFLTWMRQRQTMKPPTITPYLG